MGSLSLLGTSGHVGIKWNDKSITFDLVPPDESKASKKERDTVLRIATQFIEQGFTARVDSASCISSTEALPKLDKAKVVELEMPQTQIKDLLERILRTPIAANSILFKVGKDGVGEIVQKSKFTLDGDYQTAQPLAGG